LCLERLRILECSAMTGDRRSSGLQHAGALTTRSMISEGSKPDTMYADRAKQMRVVSEHNERVTNDIRSMTEKVNTLNPRHYGETAAVVKNWTKNVHELKGSLDKQQSLSKAMRENARIDEEQHGESFRDKFSFLVDRLRDDIRFFFQNLKEFVDLPEDIARLKTWDHYIHDMEMDVKKVIPTLVSENTMPQCLDTLVTLMNFRDSVMALLFNGVLFQRAVLDWDLKSQTSYADKPMVDMAELVVEMYSKTESVSAKLVAEVPTIAQPGPFSYDKTRFDKSEDGRVADQTPLQCRFITALRQMQSLDKGLRNMKFGQQVIIPDKHRGERGRYIAADQLREEVTKWFRKCQSLETELQSTKAQRHNPLEVQVEQLSAQNREKETINKQLRTQLHKLEGEVQSLRNELQTTKRERTELADKNARVQKENSHMLNQSDKVLGKSREAVEILTADAELLSNMFREQVKDNRENVEKHEEKEKELTKITKQLKNERLKNQFKEDELQKKETLYLRTMAARKCIHEAYLEQKTKIIEIEEKMRKREDDWQEMLKVVQGRDSEIKHLNEDLKRTNQRIDELEQQKKMCMTEFKRITGKPWNMLLEQFKAEPSS